MVKFTHFISKEEENNKCYVKCDALRDFVSFVQFKKREKYPWRSVNFSKVASFSPLLEEHSKENWVLQGHSEWHLGTRRALGD